MRADLNVCVCAFVCHVGAGEKRWLANIASNFVSALRPQDEHSQDICVKAVDLWNRCDKRTAHRVSVRVMDGERGHGWAHCVQGSLLGSFPHFPTSHVRALLMSSSAFSAASLLEIVCCQAQVLANYDQGWRRHRRNPPRSFQGVHGAEHGTDLRTAH